METAVYSGTPHQIALPGPSDVSDRVSDQRPRWRRAYLPLRLWFARDAGALFPYGCTISQEVCPWNGAKLVQVTGEADYRARAIDFDFDFGRPGGSGLFRATSLPGTEVPSLGAHGDARDAL
jgi:hypothetical protein